MEEISIFLRTLTFLIFIQKILNLSAIIPSLNATRDPYHRRKRIMVAHNIPGRMIDDDPAISSTGVDKPTSDPPCDGFDNTAFDTPLSYHLPLVDSHVTTCSFRGEHQPSTPHTVIVKRQQQWKVPWLTSWFTIHLTCFQSRLKKVPRVTSWFTIWLQQKMMDRFTQWLTTPLPCFKSLNLQWINKKILIMSSPPTVTMIPGEENTHFKQMWKEIISVLSKHKPKHLSESN